MNWDEVKERIKLILKKNWFIRDDQEKAYLRDDWYKVQWMGDVRELTDWDWESIDLTSYSLIWYLYIHSLIITYC